MRNEQYVVLSHYLETLISNIQTAGSANNEVFNAVIGNLQDFKSACDAKHAGASFSSWTTVRQNLNLPAQPIYDKLAQVFAGASDQTANIFLWS